ncbi:MAG TPA: flavin reductase family protein [Roseiflexaceae bacterium]|nr:flavin reductase family protein [Roseiflexaceae bacterium]HMP42874.1 flavin reductase family protein [Roseiflexaceae bacterium]
MAIDETRFRQVMGHFATGVTVVTTMYNDELYGLTVSSFASLSLKPQLVLISIDRTVRAHEGITGAGVFAVNILRENQEHLSRRFATRDIDRFAEVEWQPSPWGIPLLGGVLATIECRVHSSLPGGDHTIFVGEVERVTIGEGDPLIYFRSGYRELA